MSTTQYSKVPTYLESAGIYSLHHHAEALRHCRYKFHTSRNTGELLNEAQTPRLDGDSSVGITWNGTEKRVFGLGSLVAPNGTRMTFDSTKLLGTHSFYVEDPDHPGQLRAAVACGITEVGPSICDASVLFITNVLDTFPVPGAEEAPITDLAPTIDGNNEPVDIDGWLI